MKSNLARFIDAYCFQIGRTVSQGVVKKQCTIIVNAFETHHIDIVIRYCNQLLRIKSVPDL
ncbi:hypothetical protein ED328_14360 [Muribaculaceae bacterium Isolate-001 (NCI)]|nr:hypothetical protein ED328_14360 [Muribaculaceae bacterium Isolate-001 (NCI)]